MAVIPDHVCGLSLTVRAIFIHLAMLLPKYAKSREVLKTKKWT